MPGYLKGPIAKLTNARPLGSDSLWKCDFASKGNHIVQIRWSWGRPVCAGKITSFYWINRGFFFKTRIDWFNCMLIHIRRSIWSLLPMTNNKHPCSLSSFVAFYPTQYFYCQTLISVFHNQTVDVELVNIATENDVVCIKYSNGKLQKKGSKKCPALLGKLSGIIVSMLRQCDIMTELNRIIHLTWVDMPTWCMLCAQSLPFHVFIWPVLITEN